ncbi:MAG: hypothetical protein AB1758_38275, partial [Candidatus Eremiobacterota bacterium]
MQIRTTTLPAARLPARAKLHARSLEDSRGPVSRLQRRGVQAASDILGGFQVFSSAAATGRLGYAATLFSLVWGTAFGGVAAAVGGITLATASSREGSLRTRGLVSGSLGIAA